MVNKGTGIGFSYQESTPWNETPFITKLLFIAGMIAFPIGIVSFLVLQEEWCFLISALGFSSIFIAPLFNGKTNSVKSFICGIFIAIPILVVLFYHLVVNDIVNEFILISILMFFLFTGVGVILLAINSKEKQRHKRCSYRTKAQIYDIDQRRIGRDIIITGNDYEYGLQIQGTNLALLYWVNGQQIIVKRDLYETYSNEKLLSLIQNGVDIRFNPYDPEEFVIEGSNANQIYSLLGWSFIGCGIMILLLIFLRTIM